MMQRWPRASVSTPSGARCKVFPEDFEVSELPSVTPTGAGEHLLVRVQKVDMTTTDAARALAGHFGVDSGSVGYAGMKDKRAVARQWLSVRTSEAVDDGLKVPVADGSLTVLTSGRHERKLRPGQLLGNAFRIRLRDVEGNGWRDALPRLAAEGAPNYFGPQRFGRDNFEQARSWLPERRRRRVSRFRQGLYLSVLRSYLFNEVLAARVRDGTWKEPLCGDVVECGWPSGPLWGRGRLATRGPVAELEEAAVAGLADIRDGLEHAGLTQERRPLGLKPLDFEWEVEPAGSLLLGFSLPPGAYATSLLREAFALDVGDGDEPI